MKTLKIFATVSVLYLAILSNASLAYQTQYQNGAVNNHHVNPIQHQNRIAYELRSGNRAHFESRHGNSHYHGIHQKVSHHYSERRSNSTERHDSRYGMYAVNHHFGAQQHVTQHRSRPR
ncbi:hypothetical protein [Sulfurirhabdus autotrophica]|uniref:Uncharacterized protein n=1 Tax=Sulfurirhabdus autotrophica TaxID=1706046 RepID=A0A4R3Y2I7_9PROT|nr:hypothetical protein [Sulfurirhabdus autotrophica]TCV85916.1 hypothetical protein EDC63_108124 [Sulfurirhabdus autotrophica]